jgi:hypothetical protein
MLKQIFKIYQITNINPSCKVLITPLGFTVSAVFSGTEAALTLKLLFLWFVTTTTIHKFSISKTQTQQQYTNSTHNNTPKTHWIQTSQHSKKSINKNTLQHPIGQTHFAVGETQNPKPKPISPSEAEQPKSQISNPKRRCQRGPNPNKDAAAAPNGQIGHRRRHPR